MNYLPQPNPQQKKSFRYADIKQRLHLIKQDLNAKIVTDSFVKQSFKPISSPQIKKTHEKKIKPLIKINKNLQNVFPQNFFSSNNRFKLQSDRRQQFSVRRCSNLMLQQVLSINQIVKYQEPSFLGYQTIEICKNRPVKCLIFAEDSQKSKRINRYKIKSIKSARTSIEKKYDITFSFQKEKQSPLPQTAQTLQNIDEDELCNVTFGNGFSKQYKSNYYTKKISETKIDQNSKQNVKNSSSYRMRNFASLQLKKEIQKNSIRRKIETNQYQGKRLNLERVSSISRKGQCRIDASKKQSDQQASQGKNPFVKIRFGMDEIMRKKTLVLPIVNGAQAYQQNRQRQARLANFLY